MFEATGLRKNVSFLDAVSLNVGVMSAGPTLAVIGLTMVLLTSVSEINLIYSALISVVLVIPLMIVYTMLGRRISRTGGDYVWVSRAFGGLVGTSAGFKLTSNLAKIWERFGQKSISNVSRW